MQMQAAIPTATEYADIVERRAGTRYHCVLTTLGRRVGATQWVARAQKLYTVGTTN